MTSENHPQTVFQKIRNGILDRFGIFPGTLGKANEANGGHLTAAKAATIITAEASTGKKLEYTTKKQGD